MAKEIATFVIGFATIVFYQDCDNCDLSCNNCGFLRQLWLVLRHFWLIMKFVNIATIVITSGAPHQFSLEIKD